tara:strand:+ start:395 stop:535 length:141 start_codon:yes stop_codon:yes gene_type:complete
MKESLGILSGRLFKRLSKKEIAAKVSWIFTAILILSIRQSCLHFLE